MDDNEKKIRAAAVKLVDDLRRLKDSEAIECVLSFMQERGLLLPKALEVKPMELNHIYEMAIRHYVETPFGIILRNKGLDGRHVNTFCYLKAAVMYLTSRGVLHQDVKLLIEGSGSEVAG